MSLRERLTTPNVGAFDRALRTAPFLVFLYVWATGALGGAGLVVLGVASVMLLVTAVTGLCSIYALFGLSTRKSAA